MTEASVRRQVLEKRDADTTALSRGPAAIACLHHSI
jgi:hypothetical protein